MAHALIVDDSASTLESLEQLVKLEGFTTATAATMDQARVELAKQPPDVVLVDLNLPDGSGLSLFDSINGAVGYASCRRADHWTGEPGLCG
jgi:DNA-binding response OmpR family regulator